ncbi:sugar porter family MFS transporter [Chitinophaga ginsengisoli]|uniref:Sugar porter (SP) family MFS transporter n=1 Tax=Chitinophaga ginsengisoli TaxID=363837 RepID=A0A2P8FNL1_9BACT|nr:sugar porter family MFS transporter [Chitinophaga ginsengisoli]PSL23307.1 sugar porter (SP) family MFS transporter [Chitinophaga ginsengisoli]
MTNKTVFFWAFVVALGGFLFGFDTAVISGAEQSIQQYWGLSEVQHGFTVSIALIGTVFGALGGSIPSDRLGRKSTLVLVAAVYLFSAIGTAMATNWYLFLLCRFIGGLGVGASSVTAPIYISEVSPAKYRGRMVALFQFNVVLGILISYLSNYLIGMGGDSSWRLMLGVQAVPAGLFLVLLKWVPESPRWLLIKGLREPAAIATLKVINPEGYQADIDTIRQSQQAPASTVQSEKLFKAKYNTPVMLAVLFAMFNQVSGINAIIYYAPRIFEMSGLGAGSSLLSTVGIGIVNFIFTLTAIRFIDRIGRRQLMLIGTVGLIATLGLVAVSFYMHTGGIAVVSYLLIYIAFFAFSQGAVIWVFISEIFPNQVRAKGQTLGSFTHWIMAAVIAFTFPYLASRIGGGHIFLFFCVMMVLQLVFVLRWMPETKGRTLEEIEMTMVVH